MRSLIFSLLGVCLASAQPYVISTAAGGARVAFPAQGTTAADLRLILPAYAATDAAGNIYVSDSYYDRIFRIAPSGAVTSFAGTDTGFGGDGGAPAAARFNGVSGLAVSASGDLYVCDRRNARVRKISGSAITTVAGNGSFTPAPDGSQATSGGAGSATGIALDNAGNFYFSDASNHIVRKVDSAGVVTTVAGVAGRAGFSGDGGPATAATLQGPGGIALDGQGNLYIADSGNNRVRRVNAQGRIDTVVGTGVAGETGDSGPAVSAQINVPTDVVVSRDGDLFLTSRSGGRVRRLRGTTISTVAGGGNGRNFPSSARLFDLALPNALALTAAGDLLVLDDGRRQLYRINVAADSIQLAAGAIAAEAAGDNGPAVQSALLQPIGVAVDPDGNVYVSDVVDNRIRRIAPNGSITTFAGNGTLGQTEGGARSAELGRPRGMALDRNRNLYVAATWGGYVRRISPNGLVSNFAGGSATGFAGDNGPAASARLNAPASVAIDRDDNVYIADSANNRIRRVTPNGNINTFAGAGTRGFAGDGGPAFSAQLSAPLGVAVDAQGNVFIADTGNHRVRRVDRSGNISTVAGTGEPGTGAAQLWLPSGLAFDAAGNLLIAMQGGGQLRALMRDGSLTVVAGTGSSGFSGDGGRADGAQLAGMNGITVGPDGSIFVVDTNNERVRKLELQRLTAGGVLNRASRSPGPVAPHQIVIIQGIGLGPAAEVTATPDASGRLPRTLGGTRVLFDGTAAPLLAAQEQQVIAAVPASIGDAVRLRVEYQGRLTNEVTLQAAQTAPGIFVRPEAGQAAATNEDGSSNQESAPAPVGSVVTFTVTGLGTVQGLEEGQVAGEEEVRPVQPIEVMIGGVTAEVTGARVAARQPAGVVAVSVRIPEGVEPGPAVPLTLRAGSTGSQPGVTLAISAP